MRIINILEKNGFNRVKGVGYFSSIVPDAVCSIYKKDKMTVTIGLGEKNYPPTLLYPVPSSTIIVNNTITVKTMNAGEVIGWLENNTDENIIKFIYKYYE